MSRHKKKKNKSYKEKNSQATMHSAIRHWRHSSICFNPLIILSHSFILFPSYNPLHDAKFPLCFPFPSDISFAIL